MIEKAVGAVVDALKNVANVKSVQEGVRALQVPAAKMPAVTVDVGIEEEAVVSYDGAKEVTLSVRIEGMSSWRTTAEKNTLFFNVIEGVKEAMQGVEVEGFKTVECSIDNVSYVADNSIGLYEIRLKIRLIGG